MLCFGKSFQGQAELPEAEGSSQQKCLAGTGLKVISIKKTHSKPSDLHVPMYFG